MKLWIDADAAPQAVKEICFRTSERLTLDTVLVANHRVMIPAGYVHLKAIRVEAHATLPIATSLSMPSRGTWP